MSDDAGRYYRERAEAELMMARNASNEAVRKVHQKLAAHYLNRISSDHGPSRSPGAQNGTSV